MTGVISARWCLNSIQVPKVFDVGICIFFYKSVYLYICAVNKPLRYWLNIIAKKLYKMCVSRIQILIQRKIVQYGLCKHLQFDYSDIFFFFEVSFERYNVSQFCTLYNWHNKTYYNIRCRFTHRVKSIYPKRAVILNSHLSCWFLNRLYFWIHSSLSHTE